MTADRIGLLPDEPTRVDTTLWARLGSALGRGLRTLLHHFSGDALYRPTSALGERRPITTFGPAGWH